MNKVRLSRDSEVDALVESACEVVRDLLHDSFGEQKPDDHTTTLLATEIRRTVLESFGVISPLSNCVPMPRMLRERLTNEVDDFLRQRPGLQNHLQRSLSTRPDDDALPHSICRSFKDEHKITQLLRISTIDEGRSGATVYWVQFQVAGQLRIGVLKLLHDEASYNCEVESNERVKDSWLETYVSAQPYTNEKTFSVLYPSAISGGGTDPARLRLDSYFQTRKNAVIDRISLDIGTAYFNKLQEVWRNDASVSPVRNAWESILAHWPTAKRAWNGSYFWHECGLPSSTEETVVAAGKLVWNPIFLAGNPNVLETDKNITWIRVLQHGDLNTGNVLVGTDECRFIDFEKAQKSSIFLDLCWLSLWAIRRDCVSAKCDLRSILAAFDASVSNQFHDHDTREHEFGFKFVRQLFQPFSKTAFSDGYESMREQLNMTFAGTALAMAFYEARAVKRIVDSPTSDRDRTALSLRNRRQWATLFLAISAKFISRFIDRVPAGPAIDLDTTWRTY